MQEKNNIFVIGWDGDGVVIESDIPVRNAVNQILKLNIQKSNLTSWTALTEIVQRETGDKNKADEMTAYWFDPDTLRKSPPNDEILEVITKCKVLSDTEQRFITTRVARCADITRDWLKEYVTGIDWNTNLHIRQINDLRSGDDFKVGTLLAYNVGFMSEDNSTTVSRILAGVPKCRVGYINQPWNQEDKDQNHALLRVSPNNSQELYKRIIKARDEFFKQC